MNEVLAQQLQRLGELRGQREGIEAQEEELVRAVRGQMSEHGMSSICSDDYEAKLVTQERLTVDPVAFRRAVKPTEFMGAVGINVTAAREILGDKKLRTISQASEVVQLRITSRARQAAAAPDARQEQREDQ